MAKVTLTRPNVYETEGVRLLPGVNDVADNDLARLTANKIVQKDINAGAIIVHHTSKPDPEPETDVDEVAHTDALIELARGDGRTTEVREARDALESMGVTWDE